MGNGAAQPNATVRKNLSVCIVHGCPELTRTRYCDQHLKEYRRTQREKYPDTRPSAKQRGYDNQWRKTRKQFLRMHPICQDERGCIEPATDVDHIDGLGPKGPLGHDFSNLRALCHSCHSKRTARDQPGGWAAQHKRS